MRNARRARPRKVAPFSSLPAYSPLPLRPAIRIPLLHSASGRISPLTSSPGSRIPLLHPASGSIGSNLPTLHSFLLSRWPTPEHPSTRPTHPARHRPCRSDRIPLRTLIRREDRVRFLGGRISRRTDDHARALHCRVHARAALRENRLDLRALVHREVERFVPARQ